MEIKLLDCTMRDGGYVNDWEFGNSCIQYMLQRFIKSGVDIVEIGFLDERRNPDKNRTIFPDTQSMNQVFGKVNKQNTTLVAMIDYGTCGAEHIQNKSDVLIDGIRIIFKKPNMYKAIDFGKQLIEKGYFITLQLVSVTTYSDRDILDFCEAANQINPYAIGIVDTYGLMHKEQVKHYFELLDHNLKEDVAIGYHSHNNFQLAYANTIELLDLKTNRTVILDGSAYGMGKSAGNAPVELLAMHLNDSYNKNYDINQFLEVIDTCIMPIFNKQRWGYSLMYYLSASNNCHPNYINYLLSKKTLSVKAINTIVAGIAPEKKLNYDADHIKMLYARFQSKKYEDSVAINELVEKYGDKDILLLAPGKSIMEEYEKVQKYIDEHDVLVLSVNFVPERYLVDGIFIGNSKRYGTMIEQISALQPRPVITATSNVTSLNRDFDYMINMERLVDIREDIVDNSTAMILNLLKIVGVRSVVLAGFDGYGMLDEDAYCNECLSLSDDTIRLQRVNEQLKEKIAELSKEMKIMFLTESKYEDK